METKIGIFATRETIGQVIARTPRLRQPMAAGNRPSLLARLVRVLAAIVTLSAMASAQVTLVPDTPVVTRTATGITVTAAGAGKVSVSGLGITGTVELVAPTPPAATVVSSSNVQFNSTVNMQIRQSWNCCGTGVTIQAAFGICSSNLDSRDCPINFLAIDSSGLAYLDADIQIVPPTGCPCPTVTVRFRWRLPSAPAECAVIEFDHIEVVQTVQDPANSVPLIARKPAVARLFARIVNPPKQPASGTTAGLRGYRGGTTTALSGPPLTPFNSPITVQNVMQREQLNHSLNFELPLDWLAEGQLDLEAELSVPPCGARTDPLKVSGRTSVTFIKGRVEGRTNLTVAWIPYCYQPPGAGRSCPNETYLPSFDFMLRKLYPIAPENLVYFQLDVPPPPPWPEDLVTKGGGDAFLTALKKTYLAAEARFYDHLIAFLPAVPNLAVGKAPRPGRVSLVQRYLWPEGTTVPPDHPKHHVRFLASVVAHELGHNFGRLHVGDKVCTYDPQRRTDKSGVGFWESLFDWPYATADVQEIGFDVESRKVIPANYGDMMSYCANNDVPMWVSPFTYRQLVSTGLDASKLSQQPGIRAASATGSQVILSGWAGHDGSGGGLDPVYQVVSGDTPPESQQGGSHCLRFSGPQGPLGEHCFSLFFADAESGDRIEKELFALKLPFPEGTTRIALMAGDRELAALSASPNPPVLSITSPQRGDRWDGGSRTVTWSGFDPDGAPLVYVVLYSADGGQSWVPMAMDIRDSQYTFDPAQIKGGKNMLFRVMASSGLSSTAVDVGPIEVTQASSIRTDVTTIDFRNQTVGQSPEQTFTITNSGSGPLSVTSFGIDNPAFQVTMPQTPLQVPAGTNRAITVRWRIDGAGPRNATLTVASDDPNRPQVNIPIRGAGFPDAVPNLELTATSLDFGNVSTGQVKDLNLTVSNAGAGPLVVNSIASSTPRFSVMAPLPTTIAAGASGSVTVRFAPTSPGAVNGTLTLNSNDPSRSSVTVSLSGSGIGSAVVAPVIGVSPTALDFGTVGSGQTKDLVLAIRNEGNSTLTVNSITSSNARFGLAILSTPFNVGPGSLQNATIRFSPTAAGAQSGTLSIGSNDPATPSVTIAVSGTGTGAGTGGGGTTLSLDDGSYEQNVGFSQGAATAYFVNRLTPPSYPATLRSVQIFFSGVGNVLRAGDAVSILAGASSTAGNINGVALARTPSRVNATGQLNSYDVTPVTIQSGDFVVGFSAVNPPNFFLMAEDTGSGSKQRSYLSSDGVTFTLVDTSPQLAGNFAIRATIDLGVGGGPTVGGGCPSSANIALAGAASQSSTDFGGAASRGNNGVVNEPGGYGLHTGLEDAPWWQVDLGALSTICEVRLYNRFDFEPQRARTIRILLSGNGRDFEVAYAHDGSVWGAAAAPLAITTQVANRQARYVRVQLTDRQYLNLREVEVYGGASTTGGGAGGPAIAVSPASLEFGSVTLGQSKDLTLTVRNTGTAALALNSIGGVTAPYSLIGAATPIPIGVGGQQLLTVRFAPTLAGDQSRTLAIGSNDPLRATLNVPLTGTGTATSGGSQACIPPPSNQVSWWTGDGNANDSIGSNNGTLQGATFAAGQAGQAFNFDGSAGHVSAGNPASLRLTSAITIEAWINPRSGPVADNLSAIVTKWAQNFSDAADSDSYGLWLGQSGGVVNLFTAIHQSGGREPHVQGGVIPLNTWTHVAMTFDGATGQLVAYVNGQPVSADISPGAILATSRNVLIGREDSGTPRPFNGLVDEVGIFSRAMSAAEIRAIFNAGSAGKCKTR